MPRPHSSAGPVILMTIGKANPDRPNGVNVVVDGLARSFQKMGFPHEVWGLTPTPDEPTPVRSYPLRLFPFLASRLGLSKELRDALWGLPEGALVHFHGGLILEFYRASRILEARNIPWVISAHGAYRQEALRSGKWKKSIYALLFERRLLGSALRIQALAPGEIEGMRRYLPTGSEVLIPNGMDMGLQRAYHHEGEKRILVYCGRVVARTKGLDLLLKAFSELAHGMPRSRLWIIGDGPDLPDLRDLAAKTCPPGSVVFHGARYGEEKRELLRQASVFVQFSRHEGFPMGVLEAAALGLPLVVTEGTGMTEIVANHDCGIPVLGADPRVLSAALRRAATLPGEELRAMGERAVEMVRASYSWEVVADRIIHELYGPPWSER